MSSIPKSFPGLTSNLSIVESYDSSDAPLVWVFFYGSFINREVLAKGGFIPRGIQLARLSGFDIVIETLATLRRSDEHCVYGILCQGTHAELRQLYGQDWLGATYLPEAVVVETHYNQLTPALTYIAHVQPPSRPAEDYLDWIKNAAVDYGFPQWYLQRIERFHVR
jgi:cation transport regulator ChaC